MPTLRDVIIRQEQKFNAKKDEPIVFRAVLCDSAGLITGSGSVWADSDERLVWCRPLGVTNAGQVRCVRIEPQLGLGVLVGVPDGSNELEVISDDPFLRQSGSGQSYLAPNGRDFEPGGRLQMWLYPEAFVPLATLAGSNLAVTVTEGDYEDSTGARQTFAGRVNFDISSHQPAGPTEHCLVGIYISSAGTIGSVAGATVATSATAPEPSWPAGSVRLAVVDLDDSQTTINFAADIDNRRLYFPYPGSGAILKTFLDAKGDLITATTDDTPAILTVGTDGYVLTADSGEAAGIKWAAGSGVGDNLLYNSLTYNLWQQGSSFSDTADDSYTADLINLVHNASTPNRPDVARTTPSATVPYGMNITAKSNCQFGILQFIKAKDTYPLRGKTVSLSFEAFSGSGISNLRAAVLAWGSTADSLTSDVVGTWGTGNPTLATNWNYLNTPASSIAITGSLAQYTVENISISTASNNLALFIWAPDTEVNTDTVTITRLKLEEGETATASVPRGETVELLLVEPFIQKSYNLDTAPGTNTNLGLKRWHTRAAVAASTAGNLIAPITFQGRMRADPTVTLYAQDGTAGAISNLTTATVRGGCTAGAPAETGFAQINVDNSDADAINLDNHLGCHYLARAEL